MKKRIFKYFKDEKPISLSDEPGLSWEEALNRCPRLTKPWYELSRLEPMVRFEFVRDYWINALPYHPQTLEALDRFFAGVDEIAMIGVKSGVYTTYSMKGEAPFFMGGPPLKDDEIEGLKEAIDFPLPEDFLKFYRIHNGFLKAGDTGVFSSGVLIEEAGRFQTLGVELKSGNKKARADSFLPFYRSFGLDVYQCFYEEWATDAGVGNVLCSLSEKAFSESPITRDGERSLAFPTFTEWLSFYLEDIE
ncbi:MAG: SMI1/KNR4 family protein [Chlamydiia bacterium]|nr:SMI1/KNR4 family protein [Chlamydiia bacterium]